MAHLIDKDALVAEIERRRSISAGWDISSTGVNEAEFELWNDFLSFLDTLEVKEVDLDGEIKSYFKGWGNNEIKCFAMMQDGTSVGVDDCIDIAKHFFELGLKTQKGGK